jgi:CHAT domain-containing protein
VIDFRQACSHRDGLVPGELDEKGKPTPAQTIDYAPLARSLYQDLVAPVRNELEGAGEAVVCVNGTLMNMPFAALISPQGRHFVEDFAITYTPSAAAELVLSGRRRLSFSLEALKQQPLIVGNPLIHEDARNLYNIESVPATAEQASSVAKRMGVTALVGAAATLQAVRDRLPEASLIHFAGHGLFDTPAEYSALVMAPGATDMGLLDAGSILKMRLKAQMAVLCGCDTARGDLRRSEGFTGLPWSLLAAGVPVVMATQWEARDTNAAIFMDEFYRRLLAPGGKAAPSLCLAQTMRQVLTNGLNRHPYYWALYSLIGDAQ